MLYEDITGNNNVNKIPYVKKWYDKKEMLQKI